MRGWQFSRTLCPEVCQRIAVVVQLLPFLLCATLGCAMEFRLVGSTTLSSRKGGKGAEKMRVEWMQDHVNWVLLSPIDERMSVLSYTLSGDRIMIVVQLPFLLYAMLGCAMEFQLVGSTTLSSRTKETRARIICSSAEERDESNTQRKEIDKLHFFPNGARSGSISLLQCIEKVSSGFLQPLQLAKDTAQSIIFTFLVGILLFMDFAELFRSGQILNFHINKSVTTTYTFLYLSSAVITALLGCMCIPILRKLKAYQILRKEGPSTHVSKAGTPTMGGLYFIPVGVIVATIAARTSSAQISGLVVTTLVFGAIGLLDDILGLIKKHNYGLPWWCKLLLEVIAGIGFFYWHQSICLPPPIQVRTLVLLPPPLPHLDFGSWYLPFTAFCFASMSNGVNLTDGLDGLAAGTAAAAFLGMTLALLHSYPATAIFGVSMAGACVGFLVHNHHKAAVFMGDTGSLALGGALAAMAGHTGMFLPLLICSGIFFVETVSVILQVSYKKWTKRKTGVAKKLLRMAPIHHHFELGGVRESTIVAVAHGVSCLLALLGGYVGYRCLA